MSQNFSVSKSSRLSPQLPTLTACRSSSSIHVSNTIKNTGGAQVALCKKNIGHFHVKSKQNVNFHTRQCDLNVLEHITKNTHFLDR